MATQKGPATLQKSAPTFTDFVVVGGTWEENPFVEMSTESGEAGTTYNYSFWNTGTDAKCDLMVKVKTPAVALPKAGDVLTTLETPAREFLVLPNPTYKDFGGMALKVSVQLQLRDSVDLTT
jgi:hypothetical protein